MKWFPLIIFLFLLPFFGKSQNQDTFSGTKLLMLTPEQTQKDFRQFRKQLFRHNKGVDLFISEDEYKSYLDEIEKELDHIMSQREFFQLLRKAALPVKEMHLQIFDYEFRKIHRLFIFGEERKVFPLVLYFENNAKAYAIRNSHWNEKNSIPVPSQLLSINGLKMQSIRDSLAQFLIIDKIENKESKVNDLVSKEFQDEYYFHIDTSSQFIVEWKDVEDVIRVDTIHAMKKIKYVEKIKAQNDTLGFKDFSLQNGSSRFYDSLHTAYLKINSFTNFYFKDGDGKLYVKKRIDDFFKEIQEKDIHNVVLDLRNNGGGNVDHMFYLLSYLQESSNQYAYDQNFKPFISNKVGYVKYPFRINKEYRTWNRNKEHPFSGNVYLLINEGTYSAAIMMTRLTKQYHSNTTIVGTPVGGRDNGASAGHFKLIVLKNSSIVIKIPQNVLTYKGDVDITPDVLVSPKLEDFFNEESDAVLEKTLEIIKEKQNNEN